MQESPRYSVIVPVYNRPDELEELLESLAVQSTRDFEVLIIDDGSQRKADKVFEKYSGKLSLKYFYKPNSGPGPSRNYGFERAAGEWLVVFDSDCILPPGYFKAVEDFMAPHPVDAWGGPDRGHEKFTKLQRAMAFTMGSVLTTGGIRGRKNQAESFQPRSFNMGMNKKVFQATGGFRFDRLAEDIELSVRMRRAGFKVALIPDAFVYHKRRTNLKQFFTQVQGFGAGRVRVGNLYPEEVKVTHWFPSFFLLGLVAIPFAFLVNPVLGMAGLAIFALYKLAILWDGLRETGSLAVAILAVPSAFVQLTGYGLGFLKEKMKKS